MQGKSQVTGSEIAPQDGSLIERELIVTALDTHGWSETVARAWGGDPKATIDMLRKAMRPLSEQEPAGVIRDQSKDLGFRFEGRATSRLSEALRGIGLKINPTMSAEQAGAWIAVMVQSLSDLAPRVAVKAAELSIHVPIRFFPEVEGVIREQADRIMVDYRLAEMRLKGLMKPIADQPRLADTPPVTYTDESLSKLAMTSFGRPMLSMLLKLGSITQDQHDRAITAATPE